MSEYDFRGKRVRGIVDLVIAHADVRSTARIQALQSLADGWQREIGFSRDDRKTFLAFAASAWDGELETKGTKQ